MKTIIFSALLAGSFLFPGGPCQAQNNLPDAQPVRLFLGVHTAANRYVVFYPRMPNMIAIDPVMFTAGVRLRPRLFLQVGYGYNHRLYVEDPAYTGTTLSGQQMSGYFRDETWSWAVPLLARYTLTKKDQARMQFEALGGISVAAAHFSGYSDQRIDGEVIGFTAYGSRSTTQLYATAGLSGKLRVTKHWHAVADATLNRNLHATTPYTNLNTTGNRWGLTRGLNLGVQYHFDWLKRTKARAVSLPL